MKAVFTISAILMASLGYSQITLDYYDLPERGHSYYRNVVPSLPKSAIPSSVLDSTAQEFEWDLTAITNRSETDTLNYYWVEGTSAVFDFPDANMVDFDLEAENPPAHTYFIKKEEGFWLSGTSGGFETELGTFDLKAEFRPAVPILKVPVMISEEVSATSRATVDIATFGNVRLTTKTHYVVNGFGTLKLPGDNETYEVLRIKRTTDSEIEIDLEIFGQKIDTTTLTKEIAYEFYAQNYGDYIASINAASDDGGEVDSWSFTYKNSRNISSISNREPGVGFNLIYLQPVNTLILSSEKMIGGNYTLLNLEGKIISTRTALKEKEVFDTSSLKPGYYLVKAMDSKGHLEMKKFVIQ